MMATFLSLLRQRAGIPSLALILLLLSNQQVFAHSDKRKISLAPGVISPNAGVVGRKIPPAYLYKSIKKAVRQSYPSSHLEKGLLFKQQGNFKQALAEFELALKENPQQAKVFYEQALVLLTNGNVKLAISSLHRALAVSPDFGEARKLLGRLEQELGMQEASNASATSGTISLPLQIDPPAKNMDDKNGLPPAVAEAMGISPESMDSSGSGNGPAGELAADVLESGSQGLKSKNSFSRFVSFFKPGLPRKQTNSVTVKEEAPAENTEGPKPEERGSSSWAKAFRLFSRNKNADNSDRDKSPEISVPNLETPYGILTENASKNIEKFNCDPSNDEEASADKPAHPSFLESIWRQAAQAIANLIPDLSKISLVDLLHPEEIAQSQQEIMSSAAPVIPGSLEPTEAAAEPPSQPVPMPVDVMNILKKVGTKAPAPPEPALIAANRALNLPTPRTMSIDSSRLPLPAVQGRVASSLPSMRPSGLAAANNTPEACLPSPSSLPDLIPQAVREILSRAEPLIPAAVKALNEFTESFSSATMPVEIARSGNEAPIPIQPSSQAIANEAPAPTAARMDKYFGDMMIPTVPPAAQTAAETLTGHVPDNAEKEEVAADGPSTVSKKAGAFSYMQAVMDDKHPYLKSNKSPRTICQAPAVPAAPVKPVVQPPAVPEDAITKRMRYLLEHGTQNIKPGEAFMYSEETGEGVLFLPGGHSERRKLAAAQDPERIMRARRPDIMEPKDLQYSLSLLGKLLSNGQEQNQQANQPAQPIGGPTLEQLMNQSSQGVWGWLKNTFKL